MKGLVICFTLFALTSPAFADGVHDEVVAFSAGRGQTEEQFAEEINSTPQKIESFVYAAEHTGSNAISALKSLVGMHEAMKDPDKRTLLRCMGVETYQNTSAKPSEMECQAAKRKLGVD